MSNPELIIETQHEWTKEETNLICELYKQNKTIKEIYDKLSYINLNSIKMKYANCIYLDKGNIKGSLNHVSKMHKKIWENLNKTNIPKIHKKLIWNDYIGIDIGRTKCLCCNMNNIEQIDFHMGHIIPKSKGGTMSKENLRPICSQCNLSMNNENMIDFMKRLKYNISKLQITNIETIKNEILEENKIKIKCILRNNQYGKSVNVYNTIIYTNKIVCPWGSFKRNK
jgi:hypothetical protein